MRTPGNTIELAERRAVDRLAVLEQRQRWAEAEAARMVRDAIAEADRLGAVPSEFERRDSSNAWRNSKLRRWSDKGGAA